MPDPDAFEPRLADALRRYASAADSRVDATTMARQAARTAAPDRGRGRRWRRTRPETISTGRTRFMLSPAKAVAAGIVAVAIGGTLLVSQSLDRGAAPPGAAEREHVAPAEVTGTSRPGSCPVNATIETVGDMELHRGRICNPTYEWSDPRLDGAVTFATNQDVYRDHGVSLETIALRIENETGAWQQVPVHRARIGIGFLSIPSQLVLIGEGDYAGLIAVIDGFLEGSLNGYIIDADLPPVPDPAVADDS